MLLIIVSVVSRGDGDQIVNDRLVLHDPRDAFGGDEHIGERPQNIARQFRMMKECVNDSQIIERLQAMHGFVLEIAPNAVTQHVADDANARALNVERIVLLLWRRIFDALVEQICNVSQAAGVHHDTRSMLAVGAIAERLHDRQHLFLHLVVIVVDGFVDEVDECL
eukprot:CAMPEP_0197033890 /NCGR_PEP_ID=MMETSP1384-20130603/12171_1 /TAXON_ID=29189 /ORGANISM="Ammonia sp." /LENGTH=165 /DNA_ID=CAMNT_0042463753 /DNA_START=89 /DNA_END=582 /DNA_ORIENTATION=-